MAHTTTWVAAGPTLSDVAKRRRCGLHSPEGCEGNPWMRDSEIQEATVGLLLRFAPECCATLRQRLGMPRDPSASLRSAARPALDLGEGPPLILLT